VCAGGADGQQAILCRTTPAAPPPTSSSSSLHLNSPRGRKGKKNKRQANGKNKRGTFTFFSSETEIGIILLSAAPRVHRLIGLFFSVFFRLFNSSSDGVRRLLLRDCLIYKNGT
jgi:hypothetical protein